LTTRVLIAHAVAILLAVVAAGLMVRRRANLCWSFVLYVLATLTATQLSVIWPERFAVFTFFSIKQTVLVVFKIIVALEIWQHSFSFFHRARVRVAVLLAGALLATATAVQMVPPDLAPYDALIGVVYPRQQAGTLALFAIIVMAALWYRVPLHPLHRAILVGFAAYLTLSACLASIVGFAGGGAWLPLLGRLDQLGYLATTVWWAWAAWRPIQAPSATVSRLQPWAHSW
jgi:hypothetical protein